MVTEFSFKKAIKAAENYLNATGISCTVIDMNGKRISGSEERSICTHCRLMHEADPIEKRCKDIHLYAIYQSEKFGGKYLYFCSLALMHWVSPLVDDCIVKGGLVCGPVLSCNPDDFLITAFGKEYYQTEDQVEKFKIKLNSLHNVTSSRVKSLSELLFITSAYLSDRNYTITEQGKNRDQQAEIYSYIQYIKTMECNPGFAPDIP